MRFLTLAEALGQVPPITMPLPKAVGQQLQAVYGPTIAKYSK